MSPTRRTKPIRRVSLSMKVPTLLFGTQLSQVPDSGCEAALKHARQCWLSTGTKVATAEEHWHLLLSYPCEHFGIIIC